MTPHQLPKHIVNIIVAQYKDQARPQVWTCKCLECALSPIMLFKPIYVKEHDVFGKDLTRIPDYPTHWELKLVPNK